MTDQLVIRPEEPADLDAIRRVNTLAFGRPNEADLVDALRVRFRPFISLVAVWDGAVIGHALFSPVTVHHGPNVDPGEAIALGPMAVHPDHQRVGIGSRLVEQGVEACVERGESLLFVLGHPAYYPRFGFQPARPAGLACMWDVPDDTFMVLELEPGAIGRMTGIVRYASEFMDV